MTVPNDRPLRRQRTRANHDDERQSLAAQRAPGEAQTEDAGTTFVEHTALAARKDGVLKASDPAAQAAVVTAMQQRQGNQYVQRLVKRLRVQRQPRGDDEPRAPGQPPGPTLQEAVAQKYPHLAKVLRPEQWATWQKGMDAYGRWSAIQKQMDPVRQKVIVGQDNAVSGASVDVDRYEALQRKADAQAQILNQNSYLQVPTDLLLSPDVLQSSGEPEDDEYRTALYDRLVSSPTTVWIGREVKTVEDFVNSPWPVHFKWPHLDSEIGTDGGMIHWMNLMHVQTWNLGHQKVLYEAQARILGKMADISASASTSDVEQQMIHDMFRMRSLLSNMYVSDSDEKDLLAILRKWSEYDAKAAPAVTRGFTLSGGASRTPVYDRFLRMLKSHTYPYKSLGTAWIGQDMTYHDGLWEEMEGHNIATLRALLALSDKEATTERQLPRPKNIWAKVGRAELMGAWGIVSALGQGLTHIFDAGMWLGYRAAGGKGKAPEISSWLAKRQEKVADLIAGGIGYDRKTEKGFFGLDAFDFSRIFGAIPAGLMTGGAMGEAGAVGGLITGVQTAQSIEGLYERIKAMRDAKMSWSQIMSDPENWVQMVGVVAGAMGTAGGFAGATSSAKQVLNNMGATANIVQMEFLVAAYATVDDDQSLSEPEKQRRKAEILSEFLTTGAITADMRYGEAFKQKWQEKVTAGRNGQPIRDPWAGAPAGAIDPAQQPGQTETKSGGATYEGKTPPPAPLPGGFNKPIGYPVYSEAQAHAIARRLTNGDVSALSELGVRVPDTYTNSGGREWGVGRRADGKYVIIQGGTGGVAWDALIAQGIEPVGHTHPYWEGRQMREPGMTMDQLVNGDNFDKILVLPSSEDYKTAASRRLPSHLVHVPYVHLGGGRVGNPGEGRGAPITFNIRNAQNMGETPGYYWYRARVEAISGGRVFWSSDVWVWTTFIHDTGFFSTTQPSHYENVTPPAADPHAPAMPPTGLQTRAGGQKPGQLTSEQHLREKDKTVLEVKRASKDPDDQAEVRMAEFFVAQGQDVHFSAGGHGEADLTIGGVATDVKHLHEAHPKNVQSAIQRGAKQGPQVVIDATTVGLTREQAQQGIDLMEDIAKQHPGPVRNLKTVIIVFADRSTLVHTR